MGRATVETNGDWRERRNWQMRHESQDSDRDRHKERREKRTTIGDDDRRRSIEVAIIAENRRLMNSRRL